MINAVDAIEVIERESNSNPNATGMNSFLSHFRRSKGISSNIAAVNPM